jgi:hypothetical protein
MDAALLLPLLGEWVGELREESIGEGDATRSSTTSTDKGEILAEFVREPEAWFLSNGLYASYV